MAGIEEREAKFDASDVELPDLERNREAAGLPAGTEVVRRPDACLSAVYFDTPGLALLRRGITVRYRRDTATAAGEDGWTLKLPGDAGGATLDRRELSWSGDAVAVPDEISRHLRPLLAGEPLERVAELTTMRRRTELRDADGKRLAEIDDDWVSASLPAAVRFREVEVELDGAGAELLDGLGAWLRSAGARPGAGQPKLARVLASRLAEQPGARPALRRSASVGDVVGASLAAGLDRLLDGDLAVRFGDDPESVHQARVATRRLRSDLKNFGAALEAGWVRRTRTELGWIAGLLGRVRDADVLGARLEAIEAASSEVDAGAMRCLRETLGAERSAALEELRHALGSDRYAKLVDDLHAAAGAPPFARGRGRRVAGEAGGPAPAERQVSLVVPDAAAGETVLELVDVGPSVEGFRAVRTAPGGGRRRRRPSPSASAPARAVLPSLVGRPWRKLRQAARRLGPVPTDAELHRVRIKAKQLRYAAELAAPVVGKRAARLAAAAERIQDVLGEHHDAVVAERWLREVAATAPTAAVFAAGQGVVHARRRQAERREEWPACWRRARRKKLHAWLR